MSSIAIKNLRVEKPVEGNVWQILVDRTSPLGNPFNVNSTLDVERDAVCDKYEKWFVEQLKCDRDDPAYNRPFNVELGRLERIYELKGKLELFCWCTPLRCHAETIKKYLKETCTIN